MKGFRSLSRGAIALALIALIPAAPALADAIAGCIFPLVPSPDVFTQRSLAPNTFAGLMAEHVTLEFKSPRRDGIAVFPRYTVLDREGDTRLAGGRGDVFRITPGRHALGRLAGAELMERIGGVLRSSGLERGFRVTAIRTLEHEERIRWPRGATRAVTLQFTDARTREGKQTNSHMLVMFIAADRMRGAAAPLNGSGGGLPPAAAGVGVVLALALVGGSLRVRGAISRSAAG